MTTLLRLTLLTSTLIGCVLPAQPQPAQPQWSQTYQSAPAPTGEVAAAPQAQTRRLSFNARPATTQDLQTLAQLERTWGQLVPDGDYWYDARTGAAGKWGGPTLGFVGAGLSLGGPLPANASGGGNGQLTNVFINGRELHPADVQMLIKIYGQALPGHWWVDAQGNAGQEGGPALVNLVALAQQRGKSADSYYKRDGRGNNTFIGGGCVSKSIVTGSGESKRTIDYYGAGC